MEERIFNLEGIVCRCSSGSKREVVIAISLDVIGSI